MSSLTQDVVADPILIVHGPDGRAKEHFVGIVTLIGRSPDADICLPDSVVDELHCLLTQTTTGLVAKDCFTQLGLTLNGEHVTETLLSDGDELGIGPYRLRVMLPLTSASELCVGEAQQELLQQMAKRVAVLEGRRQAAIRRAWQYRRDRMRTPLPRPGLPFGSPDQSRFRAMEAELSAERRRASALESELTAARSRPKSSLPPEASPQAAVVEEFRAEIERLKVELREARLRPEDQDAMASLKEYEQQLNDFREQLSHDAEELQHREVETSQRAEEIRIAEEQLQVKIADTEKELAAERARVKREQDKLERMVAECRQELEDIHREAESLERDEKYQRLRSQIRGHRDEKDAADPPSVSERIQRFLRGLGG